MDDLRLKRTKHALSRKGSKQEPHIIEWSFSSRSPSAVQAYMKNLQNIEHEKLFSAQRLDLTNIQQLTQRQTAKTKRNLTPSYVPERNTPFESSIVYADRSKNNSPSTKCKSPMSGRITPQPSDKSGSRGLTRGQESYVREQSDKHIQALHNAKLRRRGGSNPSCLVSHSYYMSRNPNSGIKENRPEVLEKNVGGPETVRFNQTRQAWVPEEQSEFNLSAFMSKRPPSAINSSNKKEAYVMREKKMNYMPQQQQVNEGSYMSKNEDNTRQMLGDFSKYHSQSELSRAVAAGFEREFQNIGLALKKESHSQKIYRDKSQEMRSGSQSQVHTPMSRQYSGLLIENREVQKPVQIEERPLGTEEFYEDFFSTEKMTFNFEKVRVSKRPSHQKDYFTPEKTPVYANNSSNKNYFSSREPQLALSHRPNEGKSVRARYLE